MHLYAFTRGEKDKVDKMVRDLQSQYLQYKASPHGPPGILQMGMRPIQFWEIAFPKECYDEVMRTLNPDVLSIKSEGIFRKMLSILFKIKKLMGLKDVKEWNKVGPTRIISRDFIDIKALGLKDDPTQEIEMI